MGRAQPRDRDLAGAARWHARCGFLCCGKRGRRSWHGIQLLALVAFESRTIALIMRFDDRWRHLLGAAFICCARKTYAAAEIQGLARLKRGHARDLAIRESGDERRRNHSCGWLAHGILPLDRGLHLRPMNIPSGSTELGPDLAPDSRPRLRGRPSRWVTSKKEAAPHLSMPDGARYSSRPHIHTRERRQEVSPRFTSWCAGWRPTHARDGGGERCGPGGRRRGGFGEPGRGRPGPPPTRRSPPSRPLAKSRGGAPS